MDRVQWFPGGFWLAGNEPNSPGASPARPQVRFQSPSVRLPPPPRTDHKLARSERCDNKQKQQHTETTTPQTASGMPGWLYSGRPARSERGSALRRLNDRSRPKSRWLAKAGSRRIQIEERLRVRQRRGFKRGETRLALQRMAPALRFGGNERGQQGKR